MSDKDLARALSDLQDSVRRARALPPAVYHLDSVFELERDRIFAREWLCLGRADELPETGQYRALELIGEPLVLLRDEAGRLRVFANICRHRMSRLLSGSGKISRIVCPYHAWTYDLDGRLRAAGFMTEDPAADGVCLPELKTEVWQGFLFTTFDSEATPLAPRLEALADHIAAYCVADYQAGFQVEETWESNWKILVENFTDAYHLSCVHARTVAPSMPTRLSRMLEGGEAFSLFDQHLVPGSAVEAKLVAAMARPDLDAEASGKVPLFAVFPSLLVSTAPGRLFWVLAHPLGTDRIAVRWGIDLYPDPACGDELRQVNLTRLRETFDAINREDKDIVRLIRRNAESHLAAPGPLSTKEGPLTNFARYLARRLHPDEAAPRDR